jgi:hypothetical protein
MLSAGPPKGAALVMINGDTANLEAQKFKAGAHSVIDDFACIPKPSAHAFAKLAATLESFGERSQRPDTGPAGSGRVR